MKLDLKQLTARFRFGGSTDKIEKQRNREKRAIKNHFRLKEFKQNQRRIEAIRDEFHRYWGMR